MANIFHYNATQIQNKHMTESTKPFRDKERLLVREKRIQTILDAGLALCLEHGIVELEMKEVAQRARVGRTTLYRYFPNKQDLIYAILYDMGTNRVAPEFHEVRSQFTGNGLEKFEQFLMQLIEAYEKFPDFFRLMGMVDAYYGMHESAEDLARLYQEMFFGLLVEDTPSSFLQEGQRDGSVTLLIDPHIYMMTALATLNSLIQHLVVSREEGIKLSYNIANPKDMVTTAVWAIITAIKI